MYVSRLMMTRLEVLNWPIGYRPQLLVSELNWGDPTITSAIGISTDLSA